MSTARPPRRSAALAIGALILCGCGSAPSTAPGGGTVGAFAGYQWQGRVVHSVHGAWRVPEIEEKSPRGVASTWIGAQGEGRDFIQVGTNEECVSPEGQEGPDAEYVAFWSDMAKGYRPRWLFRVHAHDLIEASLAVRGSRWRITIEDVSTGEQASFTTADETQRLPYLAEWTQEDVEVGSSYSPYPHLSNLRLSNVLVNGREPEPEQLTSSTMSVGEELVAPTGLRDDSFEVPRTNGAG
jgi:hypothetical protein